MNVRRAAVVGIALIAVVAGTRAATGHVGGTTGHAAIRIDGAAIGYSLTLWPAALPAAIADELRRASAGDATIRNRWLAILGDKIVLVADGIRCPATAGSVLPPAADSVTFVVDFTCAAPVRALVVRDDVFDVLGADHHTLARIDTRDRTWQFAFAPDRREARIGVGETASGSGATSFVVLGIEHILLGYDHLLFLLGLLLPGGGVLALAKIVTAFTVAHSVTLSLAVLDVVNLPARLVEAVIALSIAAVAAENLAATATVTRRWIVSLCFGLVHGFGFSSVLREVGLPAQGLVLSLFGFNAGVELGQGLVVAVAMPVLVLLRRAGYERRLVWGSSVAILLVGLALFVDRAFL